MTVHSFVRLRTGFELVEGFFKLRHESTVTAKLRTLLFPTVSDTRIALALFILRAFIGIAFIQHGSGKLMHPSEFAAEFGIPVWLTLITMLTQLIGGILLILGALTSLAALGIVGTMVMATIFLISRGEPFINPAGHNWENSTFYLMAGICLALSGAGSCSLDAWPFGRHENSFDAGASQPDPPPGDEDELRRYFRRPI